MIDPAFTLSWPEAVVANTLQSLLTKKAGYSVWIPTSRQQKGVDLLVARVKARKRTTLAVQVKASRIYPNYNKDGFSHYGTWFNCFEVAPEADFVALFWFIPPDQLGFTKATRKRHAFSILFLSRDRMISLMSECKTKNGRHDTKFGFDFKDSDTILWNRGNKENDPTNFTKFRLDQQINKIRTLLR